ncbi:hypothetical protein EOA27_05200 [Mesorhizobium sp. M2A.F.Ca.ET.037.01.1.1]|uniref:hypothetical protein n=1 Tax=unclassified Mesorhizobium TaxID=325217 RepID=UPI000F755BE0|nr:MULTISPECIES: hypothetical protein [unclassified Mesorhizobium]RUX21759.1 hypothetical protein EOA27_05200 [Mesorhizobium sp. M2A.F.Ca.ET.037.01.1.1]RUY09048.1 hypothetical protein EOA25_12390 [Mesorhizobium sp. M2A.F.Ca.ET.040.01.1.1]AZO33090.1 hypothetical protein EJ072_00070 [Mesorhizobium sp. M2A.F.Ca.ET.046.03.2.1]RWA85443.1 MAG: hypothetical protein EOQ31_26710 [Mesorhizobium sp.]RWB44565.1 MAG: hypothetical protein EOQ44_15685 [Mesorhizobium sp.]
MSSAVQVWNPDEWELFAFSLLQSRHGPLHVHKIPAAHKGDYGIDYYCPKELVAYQCYAVEEPVDIVVRADRQKKKITTDLAKIVLKQTEISKLFLGLPIKHWVLLTPLHDSKDVNLHCAKKTGDLRAANCAALDASFEVAIQDPSAFPSKAVAAGISALSKVTLSIPALSKTELENWAAGSSDLLANVTRKLKKRAAPDQIEDVVADAIKSFLQGNALLDALRSGAPDLHEKVMSAIKSRARRLQFAGPQASGSVGEILHAELDALIAAVQVTAPSISTENAEQIAYGSICEWIMRCPLDFPDVH